MVQKMSFSVNSNHTKPDHYGINSVSKVFVVRIKLRELRINKTGNYPRSDTLRIPSFSVKKMLGDYSSFPEQIQQLISQVIHVWKRN